MGLAFLAGCGRSTAPPSAVSTTAEATVTVVSPQKRTLNWTVEQPGTIQPFETTPLVAKLPGFVRKVYVDIGDAVQGPEFDAEGKVMKPGQLLAELSIPELEQEAVQKAALVEQATAEIEQAKRQSDVAVEHAAAVKAMVTEAQSALARTSADVDRWTSEFKRIEELVGSKVVDQQTLDETRRQFKGSLATKQEAEAKVLSASAAAREGTAMMAKATADIRTAEARKKVAEAEAARLRGLVEYMQIRAPFTGVITARTVHTGHFLQPHSSGRVEPLFTVVRVDKVRVFVDVPEGAVEKALPGTPVVVRVPALSNREFRDGVTITRTASVVNPDSRSLRVEIDLPNPNGVLRAGLYAVVRIAAKTVDAWTVPRAAVLFADETAYAFLVEDGKAVKVRLRLGRNEAGHQEVLGRRRAAATDGDWIPFTGSERIVVGNLGALADGQAVNEGK